MSQSAPAIYAPQFPARTASLVARLTAAGTALACGAILGTAAWLTPMPGGVETHTQLGLGQCGLLYCTGIPCPSCGMTTSFAHFAHGNLLASLYVQPMGTLLAILVVLLFWAALYVAVSGKPAWRLMRLIPPGYYLLPLMFFAVAAWAWKILIHVRGVDGW